MENIPWKPQKHRKKPTPYEIDSLKPEFLETLLQELTKHFEPDELDHLMNFALKLPPMKPFKGHSKKPSATEPDVETFELPEPNVFTWKAKGGETLEIESYIPDEERLPTPHYNSRSKMKNIKESNNSCYSPLQSTAFTFKKTERNRWHKDKKNMINIKMNIEQSLNPRRANLKSLRETTNQNEFNFFKKRKMLQLRTQKSHESTSSYSNLHFTNQRVQTYDFKRNKSYEPKELRIDRIDNEKSNFSLSMTQRRFRSCDFKTGNNWTKPATARNLETLNYYLNRRRSSEGNEIVINQEELRNRYSEREELDNPKCYTNFLRHKPIAEFRVQTEIDDPSFVPEILLREHEAHKIRIVSIRKRTRVF